MKRIGTPAKPAKLSDEILTVATLAQYLRCHEATIYRLIRRKVIPAFKLGSDWRFLRPAIEQWLRDSQTQSQPLKRKS